MSYIQQKLICITPMRDFSAMRIRDSRRLYVKKSSSQFRSLAMNDPLKQ